MSELQRGFIICLLCMNASLVITSYALLWQKRHVLKKRVLSKNIAIIVAIALCYGSVGFLSLIMGGLDKTEKNILKIISGGTQE